MVRNILIILLAIAFAGCAHYRAEETAASKRVTDLPAVGEAPAGTEKAFVDVSGVSKSITVDNFLKRLETGLSGYEIASENLPVKHIIISFDPGAVYDTETNVPLFTVGDEFPYGFLITKWKTACNTVSPSPEINADLRYADNFTAFSNPADIDELDTSSGVSSESTSSNINSGNAVANGKVIYIGFDADPEGTCTTWTVEIWGRADEQ